MFSRYSVKKPYTVIVGIILVIVLGVISFQHMTTDLLPSMNLPYVVVYTSYVGATPEQVEDELTRPMEAAFATLNDVKKITSSSRDNVSVVVMQFNDGANMDTALIEISSRLDQLRGDWNDDVGAPVAMKLNPDMLPVAILSVTRDDMDILALSNYVEDELVPAFEALNGVASAEASGVIQQRIDVTIEQSRIDVLNEAILKDVDKELSDVERKLNDAQAQLSDGKGKLSRAKKKAMKQLNDAEKALDQAEAQIGPAIEKLTQQRAEAVTQREELAKNVAALDALVNMDEAQRQQLQQMADALAQLKLQRQNLEDALAQAEAALADPTLAEARAEVQTQRDALDAERARQQQYLDDLKLLDADALRQEIEALDRQIAEDEAALQAANASLDELKAQQAATQARIDELTRQIEGSSAEAPEDTPVPAPTEAPEPTEAVAQTELPVQTEAPVQTEIPVQTDTPTETDASAQAAAPGETATPAPGDAPEQTDAPAGTESPTQSEAPTSAPTPDETEEPPTLYFEASEAFADSTSTEAPSAEASEEPAADGDDASAAPEEVISEETKSEEAKAGEAADGDDLSPEHEDSEPPADKTDSDSQSVDPAPTDKGDPEAPAETPASEGKTDSDAPAESSASESKADSEVPAETPASESKADSEVPAETPASESKADSETPAESAPDTEATGDRVDDSGKKAAGDGDADKSDAKGDSEVPAEDHSDEDSAERQKKADSGETEASSDSEAPAAADGDRDSGKKATKDGDAGQSDAKPSPEDDGDGDGDQKEAKKNESEARGDSEPQAEANKDSAEGNAATNGDAAATPKPTATPTPSPTPSPTPAPETALRPGSALAEEASVEDLQSQRDAEQALLNDLNQQIEAKAAEIEALAQKLEAQRGTLAARREALETLDDGNADIQSRMDAAQAQIDSLTERIAALDQELAQLDAQQAQLAAAPEAIRQAIAQIDEQIAAIEGSEAYQAILALEDPEGLNAKYVQATEGLAQLDAGIAQMDEALEKLKKNIIPGGFVEGMDEDTDLNASRAQLEEGRDQMEDAFSKAAGMLSDAEAELAKARKEFNKQRDEALENAGLDGVITMQTVSQLIGAANIAMPAGYVYDADDEQVLVRVGDKFDTLDGVRRLKLFKLGLDSVDEVRLLDVARVELTDDRDDVFTKLNGQDGILLSLDKQSTYSTADVAKTVMEKAKALAAENPDLHIVDLMNQGEYINIIVDSVLGNLLTGGGLAILILLLFLMDFRPTITVAFSIPISVVIAFVCMYFTGITLNVLSLSGLSLGIGMLVDNSIVAIENIYRLHDEEGVPLLRACVEGVSSVAGALFSSTLTTICVFLPIVFVQGMARDLFADMGLTIAYSLLASLFVAMTVVPAMCSFLMRHSKPHSHRIFGAIQRFYAALLRGALRFKPLVLLAALGLLAFAAMQVPKMGISFMPEVNSRQMSASLEFGSDMTEAQQKAQAVAIMDGMMKIDGVESVGLMSGGTGILANGSGMNYYINIDESKGRRNADIAHQMEEIGKKLGADLTVQASTMDISMMTGSGIQVEITGDDLQVLQSIAADVAELARNTEGIVDVDDGLEDAVPELRVEVDKEKAADEGLTTGQILQFVAQKVAGRVKITQITLNGREIDIYLEDGENSDLKPADIENLEIEVDSKDKNKLVRIGDVAEIRNSQSLSTISRASQRRLVTVSFAIADGYSANLVSNVFAEKLKGYSLPAGYSADLAGENETVMGIMEDLVWMVLVAVLLIFLIMVAQFQSFKSPIIVMFTIPLAFTGGLLALLIFRMDLSIVSMLGFLVLSGVVVNNGIVFIDCVNQLRIGGMEKREALIETGRIRLRPILMTALTTILGMSTMALGRGTGAEMMQPMAVVSIGGLTYATLMTLFIVPVLYDLLNGKTMKAREIQMIKEAAGLTGDEVLDGETRDEAEVKPEVPESEAAQSSPISTEKGQLPVEPSTTKPTPLSAEAESNASAEPAIAPAQPGQAPTEADPAPARPASSAPARPIRIRLKARHE